ncbi:hypothetical protein QQF64_035401 [Cirrhinus molitorella]|uniref:Secreted protein n=1 Tax=Cirrhinus molitorella TaxID=172907 RepID=A0ABR3NFP1_9TELE
MSASEPALLIFWLCDVGQLESNGRLHPPVKQEPPACQTLWKDDKNYTPQSFPWRNGLNKGRNFDKCLEGRRVLLIIRSV